MLNLTLTTDICWSPGSLLCEWFWGRPWGWRTCPRWDWPWDHWDSPTRVTSTSRENNIVSWDDLVLEIEVKNCVDEGAMATLLDPDSNIGNLRYLGGLNGFRESFCGDNENGYSGPQQKAINFSLSFPSSIIICKASSCAYERHTRNISMIFSYFLDWKYDHW